MNLKPGTMLIEVSIHDDEDVILARHKVRLIAAEMGFGILDQTRVVTAASELARNIVVHAGEGKMSAFKMEERPGLMLVFEDKGPGISEMEKALTAGYSSVGSLGLGLRGARTLTDEFDIRTATAKGTTVTVIQWL